MDGLHEFLEILRRHHSQQGNFLGLLNVLIGRRIETSEGTVVSTGLTWRALAAWLKKARWDPEAVRDLGLDPAQLPPRDRERYWFAAISQAQVDSLLAAKAGDEWIGILRHSGYVVGPAPGTASENRTNPKAPT
jgi:hypothetical protein